MNKQFTFKGMESSVAMETFANELLTKVEDFLKNEQEKSPIYIRMAFDAEETHHHHAIEFDLKSPRYDLHVHKEGPDMYKLINEVVDVMIEQLHKEKQWRVDNNKKGLNKRE